MALFPNTVLEFGKCGEHGQCQLTSRRVRIETLAQDNQTNPYFAQAAIDELYKEATKAEVEKFLNASFIGLAGDYKAEKVSKPNRKRIALAMNTLAAMSAQDKAQMHTYIDGYCSDKLKFDNKNNKFEVSTDEELKFLLYGIEQRFYTTPFGKEKRLANSVVALG